ncbi:hypothetical protein [Phenylobacterium sp.]|uniref:hypothetical protein n=1 Tax=Phenylobacterium sp. TaxID=1871053 RepID=UPI003982FB62
MLADAFTVAEQGDILTGPVRRPVNVSRDAQGSIHDDKTAQTLGFRGGTVAGNIHMEQFVPVMRARFGADWSQRGGLSLYFLNATTDGEPVQASIGPVVEDPFGIQRADVWMQTPEGVRVSEGTAWIGGDDPQSALRQRLASQRPAEDLRMLLASSVGDAVQDVPTRLDGETCLRRLQGITEPLPEYREAAIWGERVAAPAVAIDALRAVEGPLFRAKAGFVGMFGAIEVQHLGAPIFLDHDYLVDGRLVALGSSPKTEMAWYESTLKDAADCRPVARLLMLTRLLKASSPLWA